MPLSASARTQARTPCPQRKQHSTAPAFEANINKHCQRHNGPRILSPKLELSLKAETKGNSNSALLAFLHSLVTTFPALCTFPSSYSLTTISMTTVISQWSNNIYCRQHDHSSPAPISHATPVPPSCRPLW